MVNFLLVNMVGTLVLTGRIEVICCTRIWHSNEECNCGTLFMEDMETLPTLAGRFMYLNYGLDSEILRYIT
jgi:hypothetical protein